MRYSFLKVPKYLLLGSLLECYVSTGWKLKKMICSIFLSTQILDYAFDRMGVDAAEVIVKTYTYLSTYQVYSFLNVYVGDLMLQYIDEAWKLAGRAD